MCNVERIHIRSVVPRPCPDGRPGCTVLHAVSVCAACVEPWPCRASLIAENERLRARLEEVDRTGDVLRVLRAYADPERWWQASHVSREPSDPFYGIPRTVWAWGTEEKPWSMAQRVLDGKRPHAWEEEQDGETSTTT